MFETCCPQCKKPLNGTAHRLVKDSCGHEKCRLCLLLDEEQCNQCKETSTGSVIKFEYKNTGVITCNGTPRIETAAQNGVTESAGKKIENRLEKRKYESLLIPEHVVVLKDPLQYKCTKCDKVFSTKSHVKYHIFCSGGKKPYNCLLCKKDFIIKSHYEVHMAKHAASKPYKCDQCQKSFTEKSKLKRHTFLHTTLKPYMCSECGKAFRSKESIKLHTLIHRKEKPHVCNICNAGFTNTSNLNRHLASHSTDKTHMCDECGKTFKLKWALTVHQKTHTRTRLFECMVCPKTFVHNKDLQRHQLVHLGSLDFTFLNAKVGLFQETKAYQCKICSTSFRRKDNLYRHVKNAHPGKNAESVASTVRELVKKPKIQDNPNAIKVITASPAFRNKEESKVDKTHDKTVMNGPLKLAFKTNAFKNNYNIQRTYDMAESVEICQKILSPATNVLRKPQTELPQRYETSFEHKKHAFIKNIKFKLPSNYVNMKVSDTFKDVMPLKPVTGHLGESPNSQDLTELRSVHNNAATSVIVNNQQQDHWRRRTWQNLKILDG